MHMHVIQSRVIRRFCVVITANYADGLAYIGQMVIDLNAKLLDSEQDMRVE